MARQQVLRCSAVLLTLVLLTCVFNGLYVPSKQPDRKPEAYTGPYSALNDKGENGFLPLSEAEQFCQRRRWDIYKTRDRPRKVYDLFLINTELDWLEIRLNELSEEIDYFVILEASTTFQNSPKPLYLGDNLSRFEAFQSKIIHQVVNFTDAKIPEDDTWEHERFTRNALFDQVILSLSGVQAPNQGDVIVVGDVDEIPRTSTITALRNCAFPSRVTLRSQFYYYSFQWLHRGEQWEHPQATYFNGPENTVRPEDLRSGITRGKQYDELYQAGWHCSSCLPTIADMKNKITSFSHKGYNQPYFLDTDRLLQKVRRGEDLFEREADVFDRVDDNPDVPRYLSKEENRQRFAYVLDRDPPNANFIDL